MIVAQVKSNVPHLTYTVAWEKLPDDYKLLINLSEIIR